MFNLGKYFHPISSQFITITTIFYLRKILTKMLNLSSPLHIVSNRRMTSIWPLPLMLSFISCMLSRVKLFLWFCPSFILFKGYMLKYMKCQNIWIPTLVNFLEDSSTHFIFWEKYQATVQLWNQKKDSCDMEQCRALQFIPAPTSPG